MADLAILVVAAFGVSGPGEAAAVPTAQPAVVAVTDSADTVQSAHTLQAEPDSVLSGQALRQRPAPLAEPGTADVAPVGQHAPPASGPLSL